MSFTIAVEEPPQTAIQELRTSDPLKSHFDSHTYPPPTLISERLNSSSHSTREINATHQDQDQGKDNRRELLKAQKRRYRTAVGVLIWSFFAYGLNDGTNGPLLPAYQRYYHINFITVSLIFICNCIGFVLAAILNVYVAGLVVRLPKFGTSFTFSFSKMLTIAAASRIIGYTVLSTAPPFPVVCVAFTFVGFGLSILNAHGNGFISMLNRSTEMGIAQASYGVGALVSPLISTQFAQMPSRKWAFHYFILLAGVLIDIVLIMVVFRGREYDAILDDIGVPRDYNSSRRNTIQPDNVSQTTRRTDEDKTLEPTGPSTLSQTPRKTSNPAHIHDNVNIEDAISDQEQEEPETRVTSARRPKKERGQFVSVMRQGPMHLMALFALVYTGTEVTIGGWIVNFMIDKRGGGPSSGYVSSGFFGGLALGRVILIWVNQRIGERRVVFLYIVIGIGLELTVWFIPSLITNAIAVAFVGLVLGPIYPILMSQAGRIIPRKILASSIGWISGFGGAGSAIVPFINGALANRWGIQVLQPLIVVMIICLGIIWFFVPPTPKREE